MSTSQKAKAEEETKQKFDAFRGEKNEEAAKMISSMSVEELMAAHNDLLHIDAAAEDNIRAEALKRADSLLHLLQESEVRLGIEVPQQNKKDLETNYVRIREEVTQDAKKNRATLAYEQKMADLDKAYKKLKAEDFEDEEEYKIALMEQCAAAEAMTYEAICYYSCISRYNKDDILEEGHGVERTYGTNCHENTAIVQSICAKSSISELCDGLWNEETINEEKSNPFRYMPKEFEQCELSHGTGNLITLLEEKTIGPGDRVILPNSCDMGIVIAGVDKDQDGKVTGVSFVNGGSYLGGFTIEELRDDEARYINKDSTGFVHQGKNPYDEVKYSSISQYKDKLVKNEVPSFINFRYEIPAESIEKLLEREINTIKDFYKKSLDEDKKLFAGAKDFWSNHNGADPRDPEYTRYDGESHYTDYYDKKFVNPVIENRVEKEFKAYKDAMLPVETQIQNGLEEIKEANNFENVISLLSACGVRDHDLFKYKTHESGKENYKDMADVAAIMSGDTKAAEQRLATLETASVGASNQRTEKGTAEALSANVQRGKENAVTNSALIHKDRER